MLFFHSSCTVFVLQPLGQHHLLLVAARKGSRRPLVTRDFDLEAADVAVEGIRLLAMIQKRTFLKLFQIRQAEIFADIVNQDETLTFAVFGQ